MSVYVDDMRRPARVGRVTARWSHLVADTHEELEAFARRLGLHPAWIQHPGTSREHYDVTDRICGRALHLGAEPIHYGRESGRFTLLTAARLAGDHAQAADFQAQLHAARGRPR